MSNKLAGIDLGTTYSCISIMDADNKPKVLQSMEGEDTFPSVVRLLPDEDEAVVGRTAKDMAVIYPDNTIQFVKSKIGLVDSFEYGPEEDRRTTTPVDVSAEILKKVVKDAEAYSNETIEDVVITVPAYFDPNRREATRQAGIKAGLNVVDIIEEPTAAAFYYGCQNNEDGIVGIFDLGGGTFDITVMEIKDHNLTVLTTDGDSDLGGKKWDQELVNLVEEKFREQTGYDEEFDVDILQEIQINCEKAKKQLTNATSASVTVNVDRAHKAAITVTREEFEDRTAYLLQSAIDLTRDAFDRVKEKNGLDVDKILLVGGSSYMPQVKAAIISEFGIEPILNEPNYSVSKGALIYANFKLNNAVSGGDQTAGSKTVIAEEQDATGQKIVTLQDEETGKQSKVKVVAIGDFSLTVVATKSFGINARVTDEDRGFVDTPRIVNLVMKDTKLPVSSTQVFQLADDNQRRISLTLYQSTCYDEDYDPDEGIGAEIGKGILSDIPEGLPKGTPVSLTINIETNGLIKITGEINGTALSGSLEMTFEEGIG